MRLLVGERAGVALALVERVQVLVEVARVERVPRVQLGDDAEVHEPVGLERLVERARRVRRHVRARLGDRLELAPARRIGLGRGQLARLLGVPLGEPDDRAGGDAHRLQLFLPVVRLRVVEEVERGQRGVDVPLQVEEALAVDDVAEHRVARRALLHELGVDARLVRVLPRRRHLGEEPVPHRAALPHRDDVALLRAPRLGRHREAGLLARVEHVEVVERVAADLRVGGRASGRRSALADDELAGADVDRLVLEDVRERARALDRNRRRLGRAEEGGEELRPLGREPGLGVEGLLAERGDTGVHASPPSGLEPGARFVARRSAVEWSRGAGR